MIYLNRLVLSQSAIKETFQNLVKKNAVFEKFMRKYLPERFRDKPVLMAIKDKEERFKSEVGSIKITKDKIYDNAIKLIASSDVDANNIYPAGDVGFEFQRTASRLLEMQSAEYFDAPHRSVEEI